MSTVELREKVFKKLESVDEHLLNEVLKMLDFETDDGLFKLSEAQKTAVDDARIQIKIGNSFTNDEVNREMDAWLKQ